MVAQFLVTNDLKQRDGLVRLDFELLELAVTKEGMPNIGLWVFALWHAMLLRYP